MSEEKHKTRFAVAGAAVTAVTASLCCILPLIAAVFGFTGFAAAKFFEHWRSYFLAVTFGLLGLGFYLGYRRPGDACKTGRACERTPIGRWNRTVLCLIAVFIVILPAFPYYSGWAARAITKSKGPAKVEAQSSQGHAVLKIDGMDCSACAVLIEKKLSQIPGVRHAEVSFENRQAALDYDPGAVGPSQFVKAITDAGYKVVGAPMASN